MSMKVESGSPASETGDFDRRQFLVSIPWFAVAWGALVGAIGAAVGGALRYLYPNVLYEPPLVFKVGFPDDYQVGEVATQWKDRYGVWVVRNQEGFYALIAICTHLGCVPNWLSAENKFKCPCHGSGFYKNGVNFEGPAPRPLERAAIRLADDGQIEVDKSHTFRYEIGGWERPEAFQEYHM